MDKVLRSHAAYCASALGLLILGMQAPAAAQQSRIADEADQQSSPSEATAGNDIVVTAQRRSERIRDVPISVTAISGEQMQERGVSKPVDLFMQVPNVRTQFPQGTQGVPVFNIRGVSLLDFSDTNESSVAVYFDDIYSGTTSVQNGALFDVDRVEILRGPQGTLYGRNATGGLVNFISRRPTREFEGYVLAGYGTDDEVKYEMAFSGSISEGLRARVALHYDRINNWQINENLPGSAFAGIDYNVSGRVTVEADVGSNSTLTAAIFFNRFNGQESGRALFGTRVPGSTPARQCAIGDVFASLCTNAQGFRDPDPDPRHVLSDDFDQPLTISNTGGWLRGEFDLGFATLSSISGYAEATKINRFDGDGSPTPSTTLISAVKVQQWSQELRLGGVTGALTWLVGGYYYGDTRFFTSTLPNIGPGQGSWADQKVRTMGLFGQATYALNDSLNLTAGARLTDDRKNLESLARIASGGQPLQRVGTQSFLISRTLHETRPTWRVALDWHVTPDHMIYASASTGFKGGAFNTNLPGTNANLIIAAQSERAMAYEVGVKGDFFDKALTYGVAMFYTDYKNVQASGTAVLNATTNPNPVNTLQNIGDAKIKGVELELTARPTRDLTISLGGGLLDTKVTANPTATFNGSLLNGNELPLAPHYSVNGSIRYAPELDFGTPFAAVDFMYQDSVFFGPDNIATERQKAYGIVNAAVGFKFPDKKLTIELFVRNLFDEEYFVHMTDTSFPGGLAGHVTANWGRPRTFAAQVRYAF